MSSVSTWPEISSAKTENRHELNLSGAAISKKIEDNGLDNTLFSLSGLNYLCISQTCLNTLPEDIGNLTNLTSLVLHSNKISKLPTTIGKLINLKMLDLSRNKLEAIPDEISNLPQLSTLNLASNNLSVFPCMSQNTKLSILDLSGNQFEEFPDICYAELIHLAEVKLNGNKLKEVPPTIKELSSLKVFDLGDNALSTVPAEIADINKLKEINLKGNRLSDKRLLKLVDQCRSKQVLDYVRQHCPRSTSGTDSTASGKGKKGKKGKREHTDSGHTGDIVDTLCHKLQVVHVTDSTPSVKIDESVKTVRPHIVCCIISGVNFVQDNFKKFIQLQTKLHDTVCEKRNAATIATHDLASLESGDIVYTAHPPNDIRILPLGRTKQVTGSELFAQLQREAEELRKEKKRNVYSGIHKYLYLLEGKPVYPCLMNGERVISLPPITNSDCTKISDKTKSMFVEVTSASSQGVCRRVLDSLLHDTLLLGVGSESPGEGTTLHSAYHSLTVQQVKIVDMEGNLKVVYPSRSDLNFEDSSVTVIRE
ncbi:leucine-rich repeat-containing protein 47-like [Periplaneta americana]|uniref:leucine-rich repeat-containing protein 47-like n=1 Tax=Periplaneta americana TaxID=6978 RepID=UPI0037E7F462